MVAGQLSLKWIALRCALTAALLTSSSITAPSVEAASTTTTTLPASCGNWSVVFGIEAAAKLVGALQFRVDYPGADGTFVGDLGDVECSLLLPAGHAAANGNAVGKSLVVGVISIDGIAAKSDLVSCLFSGSWSDPPAAEDFEVTIEEATDTDSEPLETTTFVTVAALTDPEACENRCGDGVVSAPGERCDDANESNNDACLSDCTPAICGDGELQSEVEQCDDGNVLDDDGCLSSCQVASCGDGFVQTGVEQCEDGNDSDSDDCPRCRFAFCGDGFVRSGFEQCDDAGTAAYDGCSPACRFEQTCGDPVEDGQIKASDALVTLERAVGVDVECPTWICDVNGTGSVTAIDALTLLKVSVALDVPLICGEPTGIVLRVRSTSLPFNVRSIEAVIDYSGVAGEIPGEGPAAACHGTLESSTNSSYEFDNDPASRMLSVNVDVLKKKGFAPPRTFARCDFVTTGPVDRDDFALPTVIVRDRAGTPRFAAVDAIPD